MPSACAAFVRGTAIVDDAGFRSALVMPCLEDAEPASSPCASMRMPFDGGIE